MRVFNNPNHLKDVLRSLLRDAGNENVMCGGFTVVSLCARSRRLHRASIRSIRSCHKYCHERTTLSAVLLVAISSPRGGPSARRDPGVIRGLQPAARRIDPSQTHPSTALSRTLADERTLSAFAICPHREVIWANLPVSVQLRTSRQSNLLYSRASLQQGDPVASNTSTRMTVVEICRDLEKTPRKEYWSHFRTIVALFPAIRYKGITSV